MDGAGARVAVVVPVHEDAGTLAVTRSGAALAAVPVPHGRLPVPRALAGVRHSMRSVAWAVRVPGR